MQNYDGYHRGLFEGIPRFWDPEVLICPEGVEGFIIIDVYIGKEPTSNMLYLYYLYRVCYTYVGTFDILTLQSVRRAII